MSGKTVEDYAADYTDPELRERLKEQIKAGDKGGRSGQWSARKSQLLTSEYEAQGGGYRHPGERTASQRHLSQWTEQDWHTADGEARARHGGSTDRYLPDAAWALLSDAERAATDDVKHAGRSQTVPNTEAAQHARAAAELLDLSAKEAVKRVRAMHDADLLNRARRAEAELGRGRTTVLAAIDRQRAAS